MGRILLIQSLVTAVKLDDGFPFTFVAATQDCRGPQHNREFRFFLQARSHGIAMTVRDHVDTGVATKNACSHTACPEFLCIPSHSYFCLESFRIQSQTSSYDARTVTSSPPTRADPTTDDNVEHSLGRTEASVLRPPHNADLWSEPTGLNRSVWMLCVNEIASNTVHERIGVLGGTCIVPTYLRDVHVRSRNALGLQL